MIRLIAACGLIALLTGCVSKDDGYGVLIDSANKEPDIDIANRKLAVFVATPGASCLPTVRPDEQDQTFVSANSKRGAGPEDVVVLVRQGNTLRWRLYGEAPGTGFTIRFKDRNAKEEGAQYFKNRQCQIDGNNTINSAGKRFLRCTWKSVEALEKALPQGADSIAYGVRIDSCPNEKDPRVYIRKQ
ncbi:MAG: hypothetical protein AAGI15_16285 [Pseudomonadota bacterium]